jgi:hypothetical protein
MNDGPNGMVVYKRGTERRGVVTSTDYSQNILTVRWDDGGNGLHHVGDLMSEKLYLEQVTEQRMKQMALKPEQAVVGTVVYQASKQAPLKRGKIAGPYDNSQGNKLVIVEWSDGHLNKMQLGQLLSESDGIREEQRLISEQERLEREFEQVQTECSSKLNQAAKLVREAAALAKAKGQDLQEMSEATSDLEYAMEAAGWRTSSWHC